MIGSLENARKIETAFLAAAEGRFDAAKRWLPGSWFRPSRSDQRARLREMMKARRMYDADLLDRLPNNRRSILVGYERPWYWFGRKKVSAITASVLTPLADALDGAGTAEGVADAPPRPIGRTELAEHIDELTARRVSSHLIGVCSPGGFTEEAKRSGLTRPGMTLVLIEPHEAGGWAVTGVSGPALDRARELFDPEGESRKRQRVRQAVTERRAALMSSGLNAADLAGELGVGQKVVEKTFHQIAAEDGRLHVTTGERASILYHTSTAVKETPPMSVMDFLKRILGRETSPEEKIAELRAKQVQIDDERRGFESALNDLVAQETLILEEGAETTSKTVKMRLASKLDQLRQRIRLQGEKVSILNKQSQILGRQIHNLEVAQTARPTDLPASEDITEAAAAAETALEELDETYEAVQTVSSASSDQAMTPELADIMGEFDALAAKKAETEKAAAPEQMSQPGEPERVEPDRTTEERQREADG